MEVPRLEVKLELQVPATATTTAMQDPSSICSLHHSSGQRQILNPLSEVRDWTCILMDTSQVCFHCTTTGTPTYCILYTPLFSYCISTVCMYERAETGSYLKQEGVYFHVYIPSTQNCSQHPIFVPWISYKSLLKPLLENTINSRSSKT